MTEVKRIQDAMKVPITVLELTPGWFLTKSDWQFATKTLDGIKMTCNPMSADDLSKLDKNRMHQILKQYPGAKLAGFVLTKTN